jgi:RimJ/RimL family protein N-acetyltransferase
MPRISIQPVGSSLQHASRLLGIPSSLGRRYASEPDKFFLVAKRGSNIAACIAGTLTAKKSGVVLFPQDELPNEPALASILDVAMEWFRDRDVSRIQTLTSASVRGQHLVSRGFQHQTRVLTLVAESRPHVPRRVESLLQLVSCQASARLSRILALSYVDSLDVPDQPHDAEADLRMHEQQSKWGAWWIVQHAKEDVGLLLFGDEKQGQRHLLYFGLVSESRNKRFGRGALRSAMHHLHEQSITTIQTQVDERNEPAIRCYSACGFIELSSADLFVWTR